jgi:hypothetical protein
MVLSARVGCAARTATATMQAYKNNKELAEYKGILGYYIVKIINARTIIVRKSICWKTDWKGPFIHEKY